MAKSLFVLLILMAGCLVSCQTLEMPAPENIDGKGNATTLARKALPPDAVTFDVLLIQVPYHERERVHKLWKDVDEQEVTWDDRARLYENGFRMGIIGASVPESLSELLALKGRPLRTSLEETVPLNQDKSVPVVVSKPVTLQTGNKSMIQLWDDVIRSVPILGLDNGEVCGKSYSDARTFLNVMTRPQSDGSVQFEITPLLQFGQPEMVTRFQHAQLVRTQEQPTKTFEQIRSRLSLRPGQFLVMGAYDEYVTGLGKYYFTRGSDDIEQRILVIRLLVTQHDGQFQQFPGFDELAKKAVDHRF